VIYNKRQLIFLNMTGSVTTQVRMVAEIAAPRSRPSAKCPVCERQESFPKFTIPDFLHGVPGTYTYVGCSRCGTVYQNPRVIEEDLALCYPQTYFTHSIPDELENLPRNSSSWRGQIRSAILARSDSGDFKSASITVDVIADLLALFPSARQRARFGLIDALGRGKDERRCLDIGCGNGTTLRCLKWLGWQGVGLEFDESAGETSRRVSGCEVRVGTLDAAGFSDGEFDLIHMNHVVEHLPDLRKTLEMCSGLVSNAGRLVLKYPNPKSLVARISGEFAVTWDPPRHLVLPPREAIVGLLRQVGFGRIHATTTAQRAAIYRAVSRQYRRGLTGRGWGASVSLTDRLTKVVESLCVLCGCSVGEEIVVVAYKH
jgi:2-polyprenyl-3-methyl-5-hydroxy-6-metoxy-1,4-benzoquinol methylase